MFKNGENATDCSACDLCIGGRPLTGMAVGENNVGCTVEGFVSLAVLEFKNVDGVGPKDNAFGCLGSGVVEDDAEGDTGGGVTVNDVENIEDIVGEKDDEDEISVADSLAKLLCS